MGSFKDKVVSFLVFMLSFGIMAGFLFFSNEGVGVNTLTSLFQKIKTENVVVNVESVSAIINEIELPKTEEPKINVTFVGDIMLDRYIRIVGNKKTYNFIFEDIYPVLQKGDLTIANLEGPVTDYPSKTYSDNFIDQLTFTFAPESLTALKNAGIDVVSLDNNHITNFGKAGITQTFKFLEDEDVASFGNPFDRELLVQDVAGIKLAFVSYNQFIEPDKEEAVKLIKEAREKADWTFVYAHWGEEYEENPRKNQRDLAHLFIDSGADFVIGAHPHVIQKKEKYKDGLIYYSLGNFVFDQYFEENVRCGAIITLELTKDAIKSVNESFTYLDISGKTIESDCKEKIDEVSS